MKKQMILSGLVMAFLASGAVFADGDDMNSDSQQNGQSQTAPQSGMPSDATQNQNGNTDAAPSSQVSGANGSY